METVILDVETTGLYADDEILEIGILSMEGSVLLDSKIRPTSHKSWPEAESINGISPDDVKDAPTLDELRTQIIDCVKGKEVIIYNADFDSMFLSDELSHAKKITCCMLAFAPVYGEWHDYFESYTCYVCHEWKGKQHLPFVNT